MSRPARDLALDALRGIAAAAVVFQHLMVAFSRGSTDPDVAGLGMALGGTLIDWGRFGVVLFFLISGYIVPDGSVRPDTHWMARRHPARAFSQT